MICHPCTGFPISVLVYAFVLGVKTVRAGTKSSVRPDGVTELQSPERDVLRVKTSVKLLINTASAKCQSVRAGLADLSSLGQA